MRRSFPSLALFAMLGLTGCHGGEGVVVEETASATTAVVDGVFSGPDQDAGVLVQYDFNGQGSFLLCSGVLLAPNVLATARHCVAEWEKQPFGCDVQGELLGAGGFFHPGELDPVNIKVYVGNEKHLLVGGVPAAQGVQIFHDGGANLCSHDVAFVLLDQEIDSVPLMPMRLGKQPQVDESITIVGWGDVDGSTVDFEIKRTYRSGITIDEVGPLEADPNAEGVGMPPRAFATGPAVCQGDSGSPAISDAGAVIGIAANFVGPNGAESTDPCSLATVQSMFMQLTAFEEPLHAAFEAAGQPLWREGHAYPASVEAGGACIDHIDCASNMCGEDSVCAQACAADSDCSSDHVCDIDGDVGYCVVADQEASDASGCAVAPKHRGASGWWFSLAGFALLLRRRP